MRIDRKTGEVFAAKGCGAAVPLAANTPLCKTGVIPKLTGDEFFEDYETLLTDGNDTFLKCRTRQTAGRAFVDYCAFSIADCKDSHKVAWDAANVIGDYVSRNMGECEIKPGRGALFYESSVKITQAGTLLANVFFGGEYQKSTVHVQFPGSFWLNDDDGQNAAFVESLALACKVEHLSRIDICRDVFDNALTIQDCRDAYHDRRFRPSKGVMPSSHEHVDAWRGSTFAVGRRENGKMIRCYEKSMQLAREPGWLRVELELRSVGRRVPVTALTKAAEHFAGANEFCASLLEFVQPSRVVTAQKSALLGAKHLLMHLRRSYGRFIGSAAASGWDGQTMLSAIAHSWDGKFPARLRMGSIKEMQQHLDVAYRQLLQPQCSPTLIPVL